MVKVIFIIFSLILILLVKSEPILGQQDIKEVMDNELKIGYKPIDIESIVENDMIKHHVTFVKSDDRVHIAYDLEFDQIKEKLIEFATRRYRPIDFSVYKFGGRVYYSTIWVYDGRPGIYVFNITNHEEFTTWLEENIKIGYKPIKIKTYVLNGAYNYIGILVADNNDRPYFLNHTYSDFSKNSIKKKKEGYSPISISSAFFDNSWNYNVNFIKTSFPSRHITNASPDRFKQYLLRNDDDEFALADLNVNYTGSVYRYDACFIKDGSDTHFYWNLETDITKYVGERINGMKHGTGVYFFDTGDYYTGEWQDDIIHGTGTYVWGKNKWYGHKYEGEFRKGIRNGKGKMHYPNGAIYMGNWVNNFKHGSGFILWMKGRWNGYKFLGEFKEGKRDGYGIIISPEGEIYRSNWVKGRMSPIN